jgi:hypothetical protein
MPRPLPPQRTVAPKHRRARAVIAGSIAAAALIAGVSTVAVALTPGDDQVVATVDGAEVTRAEARFYGGLVRSTIEPSAAADHDSRAAALGEAALAELRHDRALLDLGREHGLTEITSFADLEAAADVTNAQRAAQVAEGEVVYGLTEFALDEFRSRTMSDLRTRLIAALREDPAAGPAATDAEVEAYLAEHADEWAAGATTYRVTRLEVPAAAGLDASAVAELSASAGSLEQAAAAVPGASASPIVLDAEGRTVANATDVEGAASLSPDAIAQLRALAPGGLTDPQTDRGGWAVYRLDEAVVDAAAALTTYGSRIRAVLADERFDALLAERIDAQHVELSPTEWNAVNMEGTTR